MEASSGSHLQERENFLPAENFEGIKVRVNLANEFKVCRGIHRPAQGTIIRNVVEQSNAEAEGSGALLYIPLSFGWHVRLGERNAFIEVRHHMLTLVDLVSFLPGALQGIEGAYFNIQTDRERPAPRWG